VYWVSNEVGMGVVPPAALSSWFADELGALHQAGAQGGDALALCVAGLPSWLTDAPGGARSGG